MGTYEQKYNNFKQTCINIERTKNILYKENIVNLLSEKKEYQKENEKLQQTLKKAISLQKQYQNENSMHEKRLLFYDKMLSLEKVRNNYNDLHYELNSLDDHPDDKLERSFIVNSSS